MSMTSGVTIVIPVFNEREGIDLVLDQLAGLRDELTGELEILVVDDASTDGSVAVAEGKGVRLVRHDRNLGYGASLKSGIRAATYERIVIIDADGTYPVESIETLLCELNSADMVVGDRSAAMMHVPWLRRPAKWVLRRLARFVTGTPIPDLNSGLRAFRRSLVKQYLPVISDRFSFTTTLTIASLCDGLAVRYVPIEYRQRVGRSKMGAWDFFGFLSLVTRLSILFRPLKVFVPLALVCFLLGGAKLTWDIVLAAEQRGAGKLLTEATVSTTTVILLLVAVQMMLMGMIAESQVRRSGRGAGEYVPIRLRMKDSPLPENGE